MTFLVAVLLPSKPVSVVSARAFDVFLCGLAVQHSTEFSQALNQFFIICLFVFHLFNCFPPEQVVKYIDMLKAPQRIQWVPTYCFFIADSGYPSVEVLGYSSVEAEPWEQTVNHLLTI